MRYKDYVKELREQALKLDVARLPKIAEEYRKSAKVIEELYNRNQVQRETILKYLDELTKLEHSLHDTKSELNAAIAGQETLQKELARFMEGE